MKRDFDTWVRAKVHAQRMIDRDKDGLVRILREERGDSTSGESFRVSAVCEDSEPDDMEFALTCP